MCVTEIMVDISDSESSNFYYETIPQEKPHPSSNSGNPDAN